jgi:ABC-type multidrug transport system fused ATPase/permease subunit
LTLGSIWSSYAALYPEIVTGMAIVMIVYPVESVVTPLFFGKMTQALANGDKNAWKHMAVVGGMMILMWVIENIKLVINKQFAITMRGHVMNLIMAYICETKKCNVLALKTAYVITTIRNYANNVIATIDSFRGEIIPGVLSAIGQIIFICTLDWLLGLLLALIMLVAATGAFINVNVAINGYTNVHEYEISIFEYLDEVIGNFEVVMNYSMCPTEIAKIGEMIKHLRTLATTSLDPVIIGSATLSIIVIILIALFFFRLYSEFIKKTDSRSVSVVTSTTAVVLQQLSMGRQIISTVDILTELMSDSTKSISILGKWGAEQDACTSATASSPEAMLDDVRARALGSNSTNGSTSTSNSNSTVSDDVTLKSRVTSQVMSPGASPSHSAVLMKNVTFRYIGSKRHVFESVSLDIKAGEHVALVGTNGVGKSTLFKLLMRYVQPTSGSIDLFGIPITQLTPEFIRGKIGYVQQHIALFNRTIEENLLYGTDMSPNELPLALDRLGVLTYFDQFKDKLQTRVGKGGSLLSGGQRQMIHTVHILLQDTPIYLFDEPTAATDAVASLLVNDLISRLDVTKTVIIITHDPELMANMNRIINLNESQNIACSLTIEESQQRVS